MKMKIAYKPDAADRQEWVVDRDNPAWDICYGTEKATDWGWIEFLRRFDGFSASAWRGLIWVLRKRDEPRLRLEHVEIDWSEVGWTLQCPGCEEWITVADVSTQTHKCASADPDGADDVAESGEPEKAGEPDPEA